MNKVKAPLMALLLIMFFTKLHGQEDYRQNIIPPSPEASSLGKYTEIPVSNYTGIPDISVPVFEIINGDLQLPIMLKYHSSGVKVEEISSWVGIGWSLNAGGVISRTIHGYADENISNAYISYLGLKDLGITKQLLEDYSDESSLRLNLLKDISSGCYDIQPDIFTINVNGINAQFMFDLDGNLIVSSETKIKVEIVWSNGFNSSILGWNVWDDKGNKYIFEHTEITQSDSFNSVCYASQPLNQVSSWYLSRIEDINGLKFIDFSYSDYSMKYRILNSETILHRNPISDQSCPGSIPGIYNAGYDSLEVSGKIINEINTSNGLQVVFSGGNSRLDVQGVNNKALSKILVKSNGELIRELRLQHDYSTNRLTLKNVVQYSITEEIPLYSFSYYSSLPERNSKSIDHWGYYNGVNNSTLLPSANVFGTYYNSNTNREPDDRYTIYGLLKSITYPTGGKSEFIYEANTYSFTNGGAVSDQNMFERIPFLTSTSSFGSDCNGQNASTSEMIFTITSASASQIPVDVSLNFQLYNDPYFGGNGPPKAFILDSAENIIYEFNSLSPSYFSIMLSPGNYKIRTEATWSDCNGNNDVASISVSYLYDDLNQPIVERFGGGVRIKSIKNYDYTDSLLSSTQFEYKDDQGISSGVLYNEPIYTYNYENFKQIENYQLDYLCSLQLRLSVNPSLLGTTRGNYVGYERVTVISNDSINNGKIVYTYTTPKDYLFFSNNTPPFQPSDDYSFLTGNLINEAYFDSQGMLIKEVSKSYQFDSVENSSLKLQFKGGVLLTNSSFYFGRYKQIFGFTKVVSNDTYIYTSGDTLNIKESFEYDDNLQNVKVKRLYNNNLLNSTYYFYLSDFILKSTTEEFLYDKNYTGVPVETLSSTVLDGLEYLKDVKYMTFKFQEDNIFQNVLWSASNLLLDEYSPRYSSLNGQLDQNLYELIYFDKYDINTGNILSMRENNTQYSFDYLLNTNLIAYSALNAAHNEIFYLSFEDSLGTVGDSFAGNKYYAGSSINFNDFISIPNGQDLLMSYWYFDGKWLYQEPIPFVNSVNLTNGSRIDEVRIFPKNALVNTYNYHKNFFVRSIINENNQASHYYYDSLNRLILIRDDKGNIINSFTYNYRD
ncbi:hypothetical protein [Penaeicola halotolerans]|uniref:hypothetical protein n=1 Tax=Penaeicola halotolerans TaxID=2793196 RepID=UPI001CF823B6|nr:hypothetical protein [Penaeicola halotolerans]